MDRPDDLAQLAERLKSLPLIESADLDQPFAAYDAFGVVMSAILCAALIQVPEDERERKNGKLFKRFVVERFPIKRGRGDGKYAADLWSFRSQAVKESRTGPFSLVHRLPDQHLRIAADGRRILNLESLIEDFRAAVDEMAAAWKTNNEAERLEGELARRTVRIVPLSGSASSPSITHSEAITVNLASAKAASGTN